jgi:hypothetical protein
VTSLVEFSNFVLTEMEDGLQVGAAYTDFSKAFDKVNQGLLLGTLTRKFRGSMIFWMGSYLTGRTQRVRVGDYLSETIYYIFLGKQPIKTKNGHIITGFCWVCRY